MELQFQKSPLDCLQRAAWEVKNEEQTQEVKIPEAMPDIGKVLGAWGQALIRGKEWRGSGMSASGGVMTWVLYAPEDGSAPRTVEAWIPFQVRWDFPDTQRDGSMIIDCQVRCVDARTVSARKLMVRAVMSVAGEALEPVQTEVYTPGELPEDVQVLRRSYPVRIPVEAGEKTFLLDEELPVPPACESLEKLLYYTLQPDITEKKVMADKIIFRGMAQVHALCRCEDGMLNTCDFEIPFSQYAELERLYGPYATVRVVPAVTNLELESHGDGILRFKAGLVAQYVIYDCPVLEIVEDAYSTSRSVALHTQELTLPAVLEERQETMKAEQSLEIDGRQLLDIGFTTEHPSQMRRDDTMQLEMPGSFQLLCYDEDGGLKSGTARWEGNMEFSAAQGAQVLISCHVSGRPQASVGGGAASMRCDVGVDMMTVTKTGFPMVTALELGEQVEPDPGRPSLILRRSEKGSLWHIAKQCGSTVEAIRQANNLTEEPEEGRILMIPIS